MFEQYVNTASKKQHININDVNLDEMTNGNITKHYYKTMMMNDDDNDDETSLTRTTPGLKQSIGRLVDGLINKRYVIA